MFLFVQYDQDFYPGRRIRGKDYKEGMVKVVWLLDLDRQLKDNVFEVNLIYYLSFAVWASLLLSRDGKNPTLMPCFCQIRWLIIIMSLQICEGTVTTLHLYQGAFVDIGGVHEGYIYPLVILLKLYLVTCFLFSYAHSHLSAGGFLSKGMTGFGSGIS